MEFFTGNRASDLGRIKTADVFLNPDGVSLLIVQRVGKTLKGPTPIRRCKNGVICPVQNLLFYKRLCGALKITLLDGYVFRTTSKRSNVTSSPFLASAAQSRLATYLDNLHIKDGESIHGFRGGTAILLRMLGASKSEVAQHIGWKSNNMVDHYTQSDRVLAATPDSGTTQALAESTVDQGHGAPALHIGVQFRVSNSLAGFSQFFA